MDSRLKFRPRLIDDELPGDPGTKLVRLCGWPCNGVPGASRGDRTPRPEGQPDGQGQWSRRARKAREGVYEMSVP
jgi:hypothetical protein